MEHYVFFFKLTRYATIIVLLTSIVRKQILLQCIIDNIQLDNVGFKAN